MDTILADRLNAKIRQNLQARGHPRPEMGLAPYVATFIDADGALMEDALGLVNRYWDRTRPLFVKKSAEAHQQVLLAFLSESKKSLEHICATFLKVYPHFADAAIEKDIENHFLVYETKVRDEIALLSAERRREIRDDARNWVVGAFIPIACAFLSVWLASDARSTLKEINAVRQEMAELARSSLVTSSLILDGSNRMSAPTHQTAALKRMRDIENRLLPFYPSIHAEVTKAVKDANAEAEALWKKYEALPDDKKKKFLEDYRKRHSQ